ncbi:MAG: type 4a pilus biogenesis protein PilO [Patescibacteria group bacterium]|nr:type 4a pilus biogenesis protein PilO [Patescibacteria group bacterium]
MNKNNIITIICLAAILLVGWFLLVPSVENLKNASLKVAAKDNEINAINKKVNDLNTLKSEFNNFQDEVNILSVAAPSTDQMPEILIQLQALAQKSGLEINSIQPNTASTKSLAVNLGVKGGFPNMLIFLQNLEKNIRIMQVKTVNLASTQKDNQTTLTATFGLEIVKAGN